MTKKLQVLAYVGGHEFQVTGHNDGWFVQSCWVEQVQGQREQGV